MSEISLISPLEATKGGCSSSLNLILPLLVSEAYFIWKVGQSARHLHYAGGRVYQVSRLLSRYLLLLVMFEALV